MESVNELFDEYMNNTTDELYVQNPCQVIGVHGNYVDVLLFINDDEPDTVIYNVPIIRPETQRAYIFLGIKEGDRGVCRFFDRSTEAYLQSDFDYNSDERQHDINDRCFELGFLPDKETFVYPTDQEIEIGLKNKKFIFSVNEDGEINISTDSDVTMTIKGDVTSTIEGNLTSTVEGDVTAEINGDLSGTISGNVTANITGTSTITSPTINITGDISLTGALTATGEITSNGIPLSTHKHGEVQSGTSKTGTPTT